ncbi:MAG TPA: PepSY domain-containing protein, partial [Pirellulales bacterium]|nr:PepSY domain-containing protein [Pirellulales bacterium]
MKADLKLPATGKSWPDYRAVWRWHFYASLLCIPFVIVLATSGSIYLFKPQIESWNERPYDHLEMHGPAVSAADQIRAALEAMPGASFSAYELPQTASAASRVLLRAKGEAIRAYVHPEKLQVLGLIPEDSRFTRLLFRLHGELLMGDRGSMLVELAASWTIVMIVTGLYLWWPRQ